MENDLLHDTAPCLMNICLFFFQVPKKSLSCLYYFVLNRYMSEVIGQIVS